MGSARKVQFKPSLRTNSRHPERTLLFRDVQTRVSAEHVRLPLTRTSGADRRTAFVTTDSTRLPCFPGWGLVRPRVVAPTCTTATGVDVDKERGNIIPAITHQVPAG